MPAGYIYPKYI